ncbi:MAG TPA: amino acid ABC transporter substrate-binding protein [Tissierellaceae bacterium]|nr:amino acid ABC transporter substrate-binding protein [Tissierellaceae bacterium]
MKKVNVFLVFLLGLTLIISGCSANDSSVDTWAEIEDRGSIIVGLDDTFVPMGFRDSNGNLIGFDVDLATEAIGRLGMEIVFQPIDWNLKEQELDTGNIDLIWNGYSITDERLEKVNFTKPYLDNQQIIVALSSSDIETKADLENRVVCTQNSSSALQAIENSGAKDSFKDGDIILFDTYNEAFMDVEAGRADVVVADEVLAKYYISERGAEKYKIVEGDFGDEEYGVGVRKGDKTLLDNLNKVLDEMKADGAAAKISEKWFGDNIVK